MKHALLSLAFAASLLSSCASGVIPNGGPISAPAAPEDRAAKPIPSTAEAPLPAAIATGDGTTAASLGVVRGPEIGSLKVDARRANLALASFRTSCPGLQRRTDTTGLTQGADWQPACDAVKTWTGDAVSFFAM